MAACICRIVAKYSPAINDMICLVKSQACPSYNLTQVMYMRSKHYDPKFKARRKEKTMYFDKDIFSEQIEDLPLLEKREKMKSRDKDAEPERVFQPRRPSFLETPSTLDPYVPPEGDGKHSLLGVKGIKDAGQKMFKKGQARARAVRKIRKYGEDNFNTKDVAPELLQIYIEAHNLLTNFKKNENRLHDLCTGNALNEQTTLVRNNYGSHAVFPIQILEFPEFLEQLGIIIWSHYLVIALCKVGIERHGLLMTHNLDRMTFQWEFVESLEPPKVVHVVCQEFVVKDVYFAQVTVRIHTKQKLAIYDQFGRLMYGSPHLERDVLDFVVFEKNIVDLYGKWRIHDKITPEWMPQVFKNQSVRLLSDKIEEEEDEGEIDEVKLS